MNKRWLIRSISILVILILVLAACGGDDEEEQPAAPAEAPAPTEVPAPAGDPETGKEVFLNKGGCGACHVIEGVDLAIGVVGPDMTHLAARVEETAQEAGVANGAEYLRQSILEPNAYVVEECPTGPCIAGTMPQTFQATLTEEEVNDIVAYLLTLK